MQSASKRVRGIYSVIASPNRLDILRILNTRGPLSYSELKLMAGFKSKKESGKFAYHLRKLVKQMLILLNRSERRYTVTNLGRLLLNLTRQIEEQSMMESGKLYVRTSRYSIEEFNADRILQSLVKEAGMPMELAQRITSEAEQRIYKFQTTYLTGPLIREIVNAILIEHELEEYRHRLTRLGLPVHDVAQLIAQVRSSSEGVRLVLRSTAHAVMSEYLLLAQLSKDVADAHLNGDMHISHAGSWGLMPDSLFLDVSALKDHPLVCRGKLVNTPRIQPPSTIDDSIQALVTLASVLSREASVEVCLENVLPYFSAYAKHVPRKELRSKFHSAFTLAASALPSIFDGPILSLQVDRANALRAGYDDALLSRLEQTLLEGYRGYVELTPMPKVKLVAHLHPDSKEEGLAESLAKIIHAGGSVAVFSAPHTTYSYVGLKRSLLPEDFDNGFAVLHSLSVNLPRLARESGRDEAYLQAKMAMQLQVAATALEARGKLIKDAVDRGLLPLLAYNPSIISMDATPLVINLVGLSEAVDHFVGGGAAALKGRVAKGIVETAIKVAGAQGKKIGYSVGISMLKDAAASRFASLDAEKYGRAGVAPHGEGAYSQLAFGAEELSDADAVHDLAALAQLLNGGCAVSITPPKGSSVDELRRLLLEAAGRLPFFTIDARISLCKNCGSRFAAEIGRCRVCRSTSIARYSTI